MSFTKALYYDFSGYYNYPMGIPDAISCMSSYELYCIVVQIKGCFAYLVSNGFYSVSFPDNITPPRTYALYDGLVLFQTLLKFIIFRKLVADVSGIYG